MDATADRQNPFRPAPVLAGVGTFLLTAAAVSFLAARWDRFGPGDRFVVLLVASAVVLGATTFLRRVAPATSRALDVLVAALIPVDVAALAIVSGAPWPTVLLAAGPAAMISAEALRRRDPIVVTELGTVVGGLLTLCGVATSFDVPLAPLVAGLGLLACIAVPWGDDRLAGPAWAVLAGLAPALQVLEEVAFTGDGTLRDIGLIDAPSWQSVLLAGSISTAALVVATVRRRSLTVGFLAAGAALATGAAMWAEHQPPRSLLIVAAAILVAMAEVGLTHPHVVRVLSLRDSAANLVAVVNGALTVLVAAHATSLALPAGETPGHEWTYTAVVLGFAWLMVDIRRGRERGFGSLAIVQRGGGWAPATWGLAVATLSIVSLASTPLVTGVSALSMALLVLLSDRVGRLSIAWCLGVFGPFLLSDDWRTLAVGASAGALIVVIASMDIRGHDRILGGQALFGALVPTAAAMAAVATESFAAAGVVGAVLLFVGAIIIERDMPTSAYVVRGLGWSVLVAVTALGPTLVGLAMLVAGLVWVALAAVQGRSSSRLLAVMAAAVGLGVLFVGPMSAADVVPALVIGSAGVGLAGWGLDQRSTNVVVGGGIVVWWASLIGLAGAEIVSLEPYVFPVLLAMGWVMQREAGETGSKKSWLAVAVPLGLAMAVSFGQRISSGDAGHLLVLGVIALTLALAGAVHRHQPALVLGAAATVAVGSYEALDHVVGIASWGWLVVGGASALTVAALLEVTDDEVRSGWAAHR